MPAGDWLETHLAIPGEERASFEALASAIGRLARARPLALHASRDALPGGAGSLELILPAGDIEGRVVLAEASAGTGDRARLEKELAEAEGHLAAARARLANPAFVDKAPAAVVDGARTREAELANQVERLRERLA